MSTCTRLSDRMPEVAQGRTRWTDAEAAHLVACADCRAEWWLVTAASRLGAALPGPADPTLVSARVLERLARDRDRGRILARRWTAAGLAAAAAVTLAVWTGLGRGRDIGGDPGGVVPPVATRPAPPAPVAPPPPSAPVPPAPQPPSLAAVPGDDGLDGLPLPELDDLPAEALDSVLRILDEPMARADAYELPALDDSGDGALERALTGLEG